MKRQLRQRLAGVLRRREEGPRGGAQQPPPPLRPIVSRLEARVAELESEMQEARRLNRRLAELVDIVQELLLPIAQRDEAKTREYIQRYSSSL